MNILKLNYEFFLINLNMLINNFVYLHLHAEYECNIHIFNFLRTKLNTEINLKIS